MRRDHKTVRLQIHKTGMLRSLYFTSSLIYSWLLFSFLIIFIIWRRCTVHGRWAHVLPCRSCAGARTSRYSSYFSCDRQGVVAVHGLPFSFCNSFLFLFVFLLYFSSFLSLVYGWVVDLCSIDHWYPYPWYVLRKLTKNPRCLSIIFS